MTDGTKFFFLLSNNSYGSHIHRSYKNESHKGSYEDNINILHGEEKKDISKEDVGHEIGKFQLFLQWARR